MLERHRPLVHRPAGHLPGVFRPGDQDARRAERPGVAQRGDVDRLAGAKSRKEEVQLPVQLQDAAVDHPPIPARLHQPAFVGVRPQRVGAGALQHMDALVVIVAEGLAGRVVEVPARAVGAVQQVEFRRPEVAAARRLGLEVDQLRLGGLQPGQRGRLAHVPVRGPGGGGQVVVALVVRQPGIGPAVGVQRVAERPLLAGLPGDQAGGRGQQGQHDADLQQPVRSKEPVHISS